MRISRIRSLSMTFIQKSIEDENNLEIYLLVISISLTKRYLNIDCIQFKL